MTRSEAIATGRTRYIGSPCKKHPERMGERYVSGWVCVACSAESTKRHLASQHGSAARKMYEQTPRFRELLQKRKHKYRNSPNGQATMRAYRQGEKAREYVARRASIPSRIQYMEMYRRLPHEKARRAFDARKREQHINKFATPKWANKSAIAAVYKQAAELTDDVGKLHVVDHIIPLKGKEVCGLHVENNLRAIPWDVNVAKGNRLCPELTTG